MTDSESTLGGVSSLSHLIQIAQRKRWCTRPVCTTCGAHPFRNALREIPRDQVIAGLRLLSRDFISGHTDMFRLVISEVSFFGVGGELLIPLEGTPAGEQLRANIDYQHREAVITAYNGRCALSGLPEALLLDAAHIISDKDEKFGQPVVPNGIPLSKIHHAAFDAHLIGIDPDYKLHVSDRLLVQNDGPMLEALKRLNGGVFHLPARAKDSPDRERLAQRYERFRAAA
jgi:hypothetical protein